MYKFIIYSLMTLFMFSVQAQINLLTLEKVRSFMMIKVYQRLLLEIELLLVLRPNP